MASPLQWQERWGYTSYTVRHGVYRSELPPELDLTLWVNEPSAGKTRYVLQDCGDGLLGEVETDFALRDLVASVHSRVYSDAS